jgi:hypothetical protein
MEKDDPKHEKKDTGKEKLASAIVNASDRIEEAYARLARIEKQLNLGVTASGSSGPQALSEPLRQYDDIVSTFLAQFLDRGREIGEKVEQVGDLVGTISNATRAFLLVASQSKRPSESDLAALGAPVKTLVSELEDMADKASGPLADHVNLISSAAPALRWILEDKPASEVNKAIKEFDALATKLKNGEFKDRLEHVGYMESFFGFLSSLEQLITRYFPDGVTWAATGGDAPKSLVFSKRGMVTNTDVVGVPVNAADNNRWLCARQVDVTDVTIDAAKLQPVHVLYCRAASITIKGAPSRVVIDGCTHTSVVMDEAPAVVDIVNCFHAKFKAKGNVTAVNVIKTQGAKIFLDGSNSADTELTVSMSSNIKLTTNEGDNKTEYVVPTKLKVKTKGGKINATPF